MRCSLTFISLLLVAILFAAACSSDRAAPAKQGAQVSPSRPEADTPAVIDPAPGGENANATATETRFVAGNSVEGRPIRYSVFGDGQDVVFIMATIHGNESVGTPLLERLAAHLGERPDILAGRRVVLLPVANPDGYAAKKRHNSRGVDLNRNFSSRNFDSGSRHGPRALSEPESRAIVYIVSRYAPNRIVSIHQPVNCIDYDGPALGLAQAMAAESRIVVRKLGSRPGSLGSWIRRRPGASDHHARVSRERQSPR